MVPHMKLQSLVILIFLMSTTCVASASNEECNSILRDGTMAKSDYRSSDYLRRLLHWKFSQQEVEQSKSDTSFGAVIPIYGALVPIDFSEQEAYDARKAIIESLDRDDIQKHTVHYMLASGDPVIADAWSKCIDHSKGGLFVWFSERQQNSAVLNVKFRSSESSNTTFTISEISLTGLKYGEQPTTRSLPANNKCLFVGKKFKSGDECAFEIPVASAGESLSLVANGAFGKSGNTSYNVAFLPHGMKWIRSSDTIITNTFEKPLLAGVSTDYPNEMQGPPVCLKKSSIGNNITFIQSLVDTIPTVSCIGDGACWGVIDSKTDESICWHASVKTHYNSCGCLVAAKIGIIRSRWVNEDLLEPNLGKNNVIYRPLQLPMKKLDIPLF